MDNRDLPLEKGQMLPGVLFKDFLQWGRDPLGVGTQEVIKEKVLGRGEG